MYIVLYILEVIACIGLISTVLLQSGKTAGMSGSIAGGAETFLGKKGMDDKLSFFSKIFAIAFMVVTLLIAVVL